MLCHSNPFCLFISSSSLCFPKSVLITLVFANGVSTLCHHYSSLVILQLQFNCTLSPARTLKEAITWSAVSVSAVSRDMKSMKAWKVTMPILLGSTMLMMRENSFSPWRQQRGTVRLSSRGDSARGNALQQHNK